MRIHKYHNQTLFNPIDKMLDNLFTKSVGEIMGGDESRNTPLVNTSETDGAYMLQIATPGVAKEDILIEITRGRISISADADQSNDQQNHKRKSFDFGKFSRTFGVKDDVNVAEISAAYQLGVLSITLPKLDPEVLNQTTTIQIT